MHGKHLKILTVWQWENQSWFFLLKLLKIVKCAVLPFQKVWENAWNVLWLEFLPVVYSALFHKWEEHYSAGCKTIAFVNVWDADISSIYCTAWAIYKLNLLFFSIFFKNCILWFYATECKRQKPWVLSDSKEGKTQIPGFSASDKCSSQHSTANAEFNLTSAFSLSQPVQCDTERQFLLHSKCILNAHFQVLNLLEEFVS